MSGFPLATFGEMTMPFGRKLRNHNDFVTSILLLVICRKLSSASHDTFCYEKKRSVDDYKLTKGIFSIHNNIPEAKTNPNYSTVTVNKRNYVSPLNSPYKIHN